MKSKLAWLGAFFILLTGFLYVATFYAYEPAETLGGFPEPVFAEITEDKETAKLYYWNGASEEDGIPFGYEVVIRASGWKKGAREGASVMYHKGDEQVDVISSTNRLILMKKKNISN